MNNKRQKTRSVLQFGLVFMYIFCFVFALPSSAVSPSYLTIENDSGTVFSRGLVRIKLKDPPNGSYKLNQEGGTTSQVDSCIITTNRSNWLYLSSGLNANEEKTFRIEEQKKTDINFVPPSTDPGTEFHFVNFEKAYIVSCEHDNSIQILSNKEKILEEFSLNKGKSYVYRSSNPQNIILKSSKQCFVFESSLSDDPIKQKESGDSDTTTLYGNHLFFFSPSHLWVSTYKKDTKVKILDENQSTVKEFIIQPENGIFIDDLPPATYSLVSTSNVTAQFGFLDNENYSYVIGNSNEVNGFSFGDLLFYSPFDDVNIKLQFDETKKSFNLNTKGDTEVISIIENFSPSLPEYQYFTATSDKPFFVVTYSSGNNFGGEFIPGNHGSFYDSSFIAISSRISKEFSKDQKNLLEFYIQNTYTNISIETTNEEDSQDIELSQYSIYDYLSVNPLEKIIINSDETILCLQLHNYTSKGMFYFVPPVKNSITYAFSNTPSKNGGIFVNNSSNSISLKTFSNPLKWKFFLSNTRNKNSWPFTIFFGFILLLLLILLLVILLKNKEDEPPKLIHEKTVKPEIPINEKTSVVKLKHSEDQKPIKETSSNMEHQKEKVIHNVETLHEVVKPKNTETPSEYNKKKRKMRIDPSIRTEWMDSSDSSTHNEEIDEKNNIKAAPLEKKRKNKKFSIIVPTINKINIDEELPTLNANQESLLKEFRVHKEKHEATKIEKPETKIKKSETLKKEFFTPPEVSPIVKEKSRLIESLKTGSNNISKEDVNNNLIEEAFKNNSKASASNELFEKTIVVDPGSANRLYIEGLLTNFKDVLIAASGSKKLNNDVAKLVKQIKLNANDLAKASTMSDSFNTFEEAGKAFVVCKKKHQHFYVSSYKLPKRVGNITIVSIHEVLNKLNKK
ncbi:MAG: hypothetical protein KAH01_01165 [Caldisericia bacterium]|nr:hypothetical protein [Caldisericia bacterium]